MSDLRTVPTPQLYRLWRGGDAAAGQNMAQRFSDWYYAVTASRLGDAHGRVPLQNSCTRFQQGVGETTEAELVSWAHYILAEELTSAGGRIPGGDFPNQITGGRSPTELLNLARASLPADSVRLLAHAYDSAFSLDELGKEAESQGGMPLAVLRARYALKRWLRDTAQIAFSEVPDEPNLDYAPLPLYEAGRMTSAAEESNFEKWLLSNMSLCKDIAEFGVFALALRGGAFNPSSTAASVRSSAPSAPAASPVIAGSESGPVQPRPPKGSGPAVWVVGALVVVVLGGLGLAATGLFLLG